MKNYRILLTAVDGSVVEHSVDATSFGHAVSLALSHAVNPDQVVSINYLEPEATILVMDLKQKLLEFLTSLDADVRESNGILYVKLPDGTVWDMTVPACLGRRS